MQIEYKLDDGKVLNVMQLGEITEFYNAMCTAEYIQDTYNIVNEDLAKELGYCARNIMNKYDYSEDEAINQLMQDEKYKNYFKNNNYLDMIKVIFYCDIQSEDGEIIEEDFDFDEGTFESEEELDEYIKNCGYEVGEPCGYWGDNVGILKEILKDEVDEKKISAKEKAKEKALLNSNAGERSFLQQK